MLNSTRYTCDGPRTWEYIFIGLGNHGTETELPSTIETLLAR